LAKFGLFFAFLSGFRRFLAILAVFPFFSIDKKVPLNAPILQKNW